MPGRAAAAYWVLAAQWGQASELVNGERCDDTHLVSPCARTGAADKSSAQVQKGAGVSNTGTRAVVLSGICLCRSTRKNQKWGAYVHAPSHICVHSNPYHLLFLSPLSVGLWLSGWRGRWVGWVSSQNVARWVHAPGQIDGAEGKTQRRGGSCRTRGWSAPSRSSSQDATPLLSPDSQRRSYVRCRH
jgi:hypothetical protein